MTRTRSTHTADRDSSAGFSMVELLVIMGIIATVAAVSLPRLFEYMKIYRLRQASGAVSGEIQAARNKAIIKNVNQGVVFLVVSPTTFRYVIEDDLKPPISTTRVPLSSLLASPPADASYTERLGPLRELPRDVQFSTGCTTSPAFTQNAKGFRFNRMGMWCNPLSTDANCPDLDAGQALIMNQATGSTGAGSTICLMNTKTSLKMVVQVSSGGRVTVPNP